MNPFQCYTIFLALKQHFSKPSYDVIKYNWKTRASLTAFNKRTDRYFYERLSRKKNEQEIKNFFIAKIIKEADNAEPNEVHGYATSAAPHNSMFDVKRKLPLFTKSSDSKSLYCAGYYVIRFDKGWVKSFCPKAITLQRYEYQGPFKTEIEMKQVLSNVSK